MTDRELIDKLAEVVDDLFALVVAPTEKSIEVCSLSDRDDVVVLGRALIAEARRRALIAEAQATMPSVVVKSSWPTDAEWKTAYPEEEEETRA